MAAARGAGQNEIDKKKRRSVQFLLNACAAHPHSDHVPNFAITAAAAATITTRCLLLNSQDMYRMYFLHHAAPQKQARSLFGCSSSGFFFRIGGPKLIMSSMVTTITTSHNHILIYERACICGGGASHCMHVFGDPSVRRSGRKTGFNDTFNNGAMTGTHGIDTFEIAAVEYSTFAREYSFDRR